MSTPIAAGPPHELAVDFGQISEGVRLVTISIIKGRLQFGDNNDVILTAKTVTDVNHEGGTIEYDSFGHKPRIATRFSLGIPMLDTMRPWLGEPWRETVCTFLLDDAIELVRAHIGAERTKTAIKAVDPTPVISLPIKVSMDSSS